MTKLPHLPWPYRLGQTVEQDTFAARQADAAVALCTPRGDRPDAPDFGVTLPLGETVPVDTDALAAELASSGVAADIVDASQLVDATVARLNVELAPNG